MKKLIWSVVLALIVFFLYQGFVQVGIVREHLIYKYEKVEPVNVFRNDIYGLMEKFKPEICFKSINGEVGFLKTNNGLQLMVYRFEASNQVSISNSKLVAGMEVGDYNFEYSTSVYWGQPMISVISKSETINVNQIVLSVYSEKEVLQTSLDSNYLFLKLKTQKVVIGNSILDNYMILELDSNHITQFLFYKNEKSIYMIVSSDNVDLLPFSTSILQMPKKVG